MPQQSLSDFVNDLEKAGMLVRIKGEKRVDELPGIMEANPLKAVLVEKVKDSEFQFLANAYSNQDQYAWAMGCRKSETGRKMTEWGARRFDRSNGGDDNALHPDGGSTNRPTIRIPSRPMRRTFLHSR